MFERASITTPSPPVIRGRDFVKIGNVRILRKNNPFFRRRDIIFENFAKYPENRLVDGLY
jgi:hypothetical protein